jgi:hypothetical protein
MQTTAQTKMFQMLIEEPSFDTAHPDANSYHDVPYIAPRSQAAELADQWLAMARKWLIAHKHPPNIPDHEYLITTRYATGFFVKNSTLWKRDPQGAHKQVLFKGQRTKVMEAAHNDIGHRRFYTTHVTSGQSCNRA